MATATALKRSVPKQLPAPNSDFYQLADVLTAEEKAIVKKVRAYMETKVQPIINKYWSDDAFPFELLPSFKELDIGGLGMRGLRLPRRKPEAVWLRRDGAGACRRVVLHLLRRAQRPGDGLDLSRRHRRSRSRSGCRRWRVWKRSAASALTEPLVGSGTGGGLMTTAKREGDTWVLNGQKRWIGNAPWCDVSIIWARDVADNQVKGFIVENKTTPGFSVEKIEHKIALKVVQNGQITLKDCRVPEANRLQGGNSFRDTARVLRMTRYMVGWASTGSRWALRERAEVCPGAAAVRQADRPRSRWCRICSPRCSPTSPPASA